MKKLSILLLGLLLVTGFAFADGEFDGTPTTDVDITASVTWGIDLNTNYTGFTNAATFDAELTWLNDTDFSNAGDDGLYGSITMDNADLKFDGGVWVIDFTGVTAMIVVDPVEITIFAAPDFDYDLAPTIDSGVVEGDIAIALVSANTVGGITITLPVDPITVGLKLASDGDWTVNTENDYVIGSDVEVAVDPITLTLGLTYGYFSAPLLGVAAKADLALADVVEGLDAYVSFDGVQPDGGTFDWDLAAGLVLGLTPDNDDGDSTDITLDSYVYLGGADPDIDIALGFAEPEAGGIMDMLYAGVTVELLDLAATLEWNLDVDGGYDTGSVDPYFGFGYGSDEVFDLNVGVHLKSGLTGIDLTTITLDYVSTDLSTDNGIFTVKTAITF